MTQDSQSQEVLKAVGNAFDAGTTAINRATDAATAMEVARSADTASLLAKVDEKLAEHHEDNKVEIKSILTDVLSDVFGKEPTRYIDVSRVPLLCKSIIEIREDISDLKGMMKGMSDFIVVRKIVYGASGIILTGFILGLMSLIFIK